MDPTTPSTSADAIAASQQTDSLIKEVRTVKNILYGALQRKKSESFRIGTALLDLDRAFRQLPSEAVLREDYDRLLDQVTAAVEKGFQALQKLEPDIESIEDAAAYEDHWRQLLRSQQNIKSAPFPKGVSRDSQETNVDTVDNSSVLADGDQQNEQVPEPNATADNNPGQSRPNTTSSAHKARVDQSSLPESDNIGSEPRSRESSTATSGFWQYMKNNYRQESRRQRGSARQQAAATYQTDTDTAASPTQHSKRTGKTQNHANKEFHTTPDPAQNNEQNSRPTNEPSNMDENGEPDNKSTNNDDGNAANGQSSNQQATNGNAATNGQQYFWSYGPYGQTYWYGPNSWNQAGITPHAAAQAQATAGIKPNVQQAMQSHAQQRMPQPTPGCPPTIPPPYQSPSTMANQMWRANFFGNQIPQPNPQMQNLNPMGAPAFFNPMSQIRPGQPTPGSFNMAGFGHGNFCDARPLDQRLYDDIYAQQQLPFPPNWTLPQMGQMPSAYQYVDAEKAVTRGLIKPFAGTVDDYPRFQQSFYTLIHIQPGPIFHKILALDKLILEDQAKLLFRGLGMTAMDYVTRIVRLEGEFGGPDRMRAHHSRVLRHLKGDLDGNLATLKKYTQALETYLMNSESTEINNIILLQMLKGKMTPNMQVEYNAYKNAAMLPDNNQTLAWFLHFKTTNEVGAQEDRQFTKTGANLNKFPQKKSATNPMSQVHTMHDTYDSDTTDDEEVVYIGQTLKAKRRPEKRNKDRPFNKDKKPSTSNTDPCTCCNSKDHVTANCEKFYCMTPTERRALVLKKEACFICIKMNHRSGDCPKKETKRCGICKGKHHFLLHPGKTTVQNQGVECHSGTSATTTFEDTSESDTQYISCAYQQARKPKPGPDVKPLTIAITYVTVWLRNPKTDKRIKVNLLTDTGANNCCLDSNLAREFGLTGPREPYHVQVGGGKVNSYSAFPANMKIKGVHKDAEEFDVTFQVYRNPCGHLARINWADHKKQWPHLETLDLPEAADRPVEGIIGMAEPRLIAALKSAVIGRRHEPTATLTRLGWVVGGKVKPGTDDTANMNVTFTQTDSLDADYDDLKAAMERFWNSGTDCFKTAKTKLFEENRKPDDELKAIERFDQTVRRLADGK